MSVSRGDVSGPAPRDAHPGREGMLLPSGRQDQRTGPWTPAIDILESGDQYVLRADLPGAEADDIELRVQDGTLILKGLRRSGADEGSEQVLRAERPRGPFAHSFRLPSGVDHSGLRAWLRNGVLEVILPKTRETRARAIRIEAK
jgi:HSP20 family protein